jgi:hypothetical protein
VGVAFDKHFNAGLDDRLCRGVKAKGEGQKNYEAGDRGERQKEELAVLAEQRKSGIISDETSGSASAGSDGRRTDGPQALQATLQVISRSLNAKPSARVAGRARRGRSRRHLAEQGGDHGTG